MTKRLLCIFLAILTLSAGLCACDKSKENTDKPIINNGAVNIGALLPSNNKISAEINSGLDYAYELASSVNLNESVDITLSSLYYTDSSDVAYYAENLVSNDVSAIIYYGEDIESFNAFSEYIEEIKIPVLSLCPYTTNYDNIYTLSLTPKYMSSCAATYAMEKGYNSCAVLSYSSDDYYSDFAEIYKNTLSSYVGTEPTLYYKNGELANYSPSALVSGNYEYLFLICPAENIEELVSELRENGFLSEIMLSEVLDKTFVEGEVYNNCSFISKLEADSSNNVSTVFYSMFAEHNQIQDNNVSSAAAYGYDAYMIAFEALKSFAQNSGSVFANDSVAESTVTDNCAEIKLSDYREAFTTILYQGVTDVVSFKDNSTVPTYIYVDNIINSEIFFCKKYTFAKESSSE